MPKTTTEPSRYWQGYEIHGNHQLDTKRILKLLPKRRLGRRINKQLKYRLQNAADQLREKFKPAFVACELWSFIDYRDNTFSAYGVVDLVERGDEHRLAYRKIPGTDITLANEEIIGLHEQLYSRIHELFEQGRPPFESYEVGYLDFFNDAECHELCIQLSQLVPHYKANIIDVLTLHADDELRAIAANLLCWTRGNHEETIAQVHNLLDDPSSIVRNNISRFMIPYVGRIYGAYIKHPLIKNLLTQLDRPSHADRNKAIYCLLSIAQSSGFLDRQYIQKHGAKLIQKIADTSIMPNVREPAVELLTFF